MTYIIYMPENPTSLNKSGQLALAGQSDPELYRPETVNSPAFSDYIISSLSLRPQLCLEHAEVTE